MFQRLLYTLFLITTAFYSYSQEKEYHIATTPFLERAIDFNYPNEQYYQTRKNKIYRFLPYPGPRNQYYRQELLKTAKGLFVYYSATGILYQYHGRKGKDTLVFTRLDSTEHYGYNINCFPFAYKDDVYNLGGYGFWEWTGHLRKFDFKSNEWVLAKTDQEVPVITMDYLPCIWYNKTKGDLYTFYHFSGNESVRSNNLTVPQKVDTVMRLNLATLNWEQMGKLTEESFNYFNNAQIITHHPLGLIFYHNDHFLLADLHDNNLKMIQSAGSMNPTKFTARNKEYITYSRDSVVYFYECFDGTLDSLVLIKKNLSSLHQKIYEPLPNPYQKFLIGLLGLGLMAAGGFYLYKKKGKAAPSSTKSLYEPKDHLEIFTALELELIHKIIENGEKEGRTTKVEEVNHLLGVANKTIDMQKRKRSNTIRSINEKYGIVIKKLDYQLIKREKNESDGRSNEFYISPDDALFFSKTVQLN